MLHQGSPVLSCLCARDTTTGASGTAPNTKSPHVHYSSSTACKTPLEVKISFIKAAAPTPTSPNWVQDPGVPMLGRVPGLTLLPGHIRGWPRCVFLSAGEKPHVRPRGEPVNGLGCRGLPPGQPFPLVFIFLFEASS